MAGGSPRRLAVGEEERRAQSRGEWPGVRRTLRRGLMGMEVCVGGGRREPEEGCEEGGPRFGTGHRVGGAMSPGLDFNCELDCG